MVTQDNERPIGWPLGLENVSFRLRLPGSVAAAAAEPISLHVPSSSFSSFSSSSDLDTLSTASFFQDHSVSLGRLIGLRPGERGRLYFPSAVRIPEQRSVPEALSPVDGTELPRGVCVPLLSIVVKISRSKSSSGH